MTKKINAEEVAKVLGAKIIGKVKNRPGFFGVLQMAEEAYYRRMGKTKEIDIDTEARVDPEFVKECFKLTNEQTEAMKTPEYNEKVGFITAIDMIVQSLPKKHKLHDVEVLRGDEPPLRGKNPIGQICWSFFIVNGDEWIEKSCFQLKIAAPDFRKDRGRVIDQVNEFSDHFMYYVERARRKAKE